MIILDTSVMVEIADESEKGIKLESYISKTEESFAITVFTVHELLLPTTGQEKAKLEEKLSEYKILAFASRRNILGSSFEMFYRV